jgi:hypothetical protein
LLFEGFFSSFDGFALSAAAAHLWILFPFSGLKGTRQKWPPLAAAGAFQHSPRPRLALRPSLTMKKTPAFGGLASQNSLPRTTCRIARGKHKVKKRKGNEKKTRGGTQEEEQRSLRGLQRTLVVGHCHPYGPWDPIYDPRKASV